jgi:hypothetical protein
MDLWSPVRSQSRRVKTGKAPGARRKKTPGAAPGPDDVLTDKDAAHAAGSARIARQIPGEPAWRQFGSQPVTGRHGLPPDDPDTVVPLSAARAAGDDAMMGGLTNHRGDQRRVWDGVQQKWISVPDGGRYGTGKAYNPANMK